MKRPYPALPTDRPLVIAHRAGNSIAAARAAVALGADMIETDVWRFRGRLELRHVKTMGPIPLLWDRWELHPGWSPRLRLEDLVVALDPTDRLFLDLKGKDLAIAPQIVETIRRLQPTRQIILCGRNWAQLDPVRDDPHVWVFYSVGSDEELAAVAEHVRPSAHPAVSIHARYIDQATMSMFDALGATVVCWAVNTVQHARRLADLGVDGFTTDNITMVEAIARDRGRALGDVVHGPQTPSSELRPTE